MSDLLISGDVPDVDFPGHARWTTLLTSAVLGVDRQTPAPLLADHPLASWVASWSDQPLAVRLLREAFVLDRALLAGHRPLALETDASEQSLAVLAVPPTTAPSGLAMQALWRRWRGTNDVTGCIAWINHAAPLGITVPDEDIPWAWALGERNVALRPMLASVTGPMGAWLLQRPHHPWPFMVRYMQREGASEIVRNLDRTMEERVDAFQAWATTDPSDAMQGLQSSWDAEKAEFRAAALNALRLHRPAHLDEPWWNQRLSDRSRHVRAAALNALWGDPQTALAQAENTITQACFVRSTISTLGVSQKRAHAMKLVLPAEGTPADEKRGIDVDPGHRSVGRQAWMLRQRVARTHPDLFAAWDGMTWDERLDWAQGTSESTVLLDAWEQAAIAFQHQGLARALVSRKEGSSRYDVAAVLPLAEREAIALRIVKAEQSVERVHEWFEAWSPYFTQVVVDTLPWAFGPHGQIEPWHAADRVMARGHAPIARALLDRLKNFPRARQEINPGQTLANNLEGFWGPNLEHRIALHEALSKHV